MKIIRNTIISAAMLCASAVTAHAAPVYFTDEGNFLTAAGAGLNFESFESTSMPDTTTVDFGDGEFTCDGASFCPSFFGVSAQTSLDGDSSVFFATPDSATFTFDSPINAFGIWEDGMGDVADITLTLTDSNGNTSDIYVDFSGPNIGNFVNGQFIGIVDLMMTFVSVTFSGSNSGDGIFFDNLHFGMVDGTGVSDVPLPAALPLFIAGIGGLGFASRRRKKT